MVSEIVGEQSEEEVDEDYSPGDVYYPSVRLFSEYIDEFNQVTHENNDTSTYRVLCNSVNETFFPKNDFSNRCYKVAKYLDYIKMKTDEHNDNRCICLNYLLNSNDDFNKFPGYDVSKVFKAYEKISLDRKMCTVKLDRIRNEDVEKITRLYLLHNALSKLQKFIEDEDENILSTAEDFAKNYKNSIDYCKSGEIDGYCEALNEIQILCYHHTKSYNCADIAKLIKYQKELKKAVKFTPFGSWVSTKVQKKTYIRNNLYPESQLQIHRDQQLGLENNKYNIKYHTA
ncbi:PIR protein [Plasmodium ovale]|uniref:PIR protein n=1 Tax=Plasmodium ovale TaxID=36330 RepID=A0A1D3JED4_PLAOA|nr:PIR protein [Plasmodium ovale]